MLTRITEPTGQPLTLDQVKMHLRIDHSEEDEYLTALIDAATEHVQNITNRQLMRAEFKLTLDYMPVSAVLPYPPISEVTSVTALNESGETVEFVLDTDFAVKASEPAVLSGIQDSIWYNGTYTDVQITFTAGYESAEKIPRAIQQAMLLIIAHLYENREDANNRFPKASDALLSSYRIFSF